MTRKNSVTPEEQLPLQEQKEFIEKLAEWHKLKTEVALLTNKERDARAEIFGLAFPEPTEGRSDNKLDLGTGYVLQGDHKITRTVEEEAIKKLMKKPKSRAAELLEHVIRWKPELKTKEWKALLPADRKLIAEVVVEKPGMASLDITQPKRKR